MINDISINSINIIGVGAVLLLLGVSLIDSIWFKKKCIGLQTYVSKSLILSEIAATIAFVIWILEFGYQLTHPYLDGVIVTVGLGVVLLHIYLSWDFVFISRSFSFQHVPTYIAFIVMILFAQTSIGYYTMVAYVGWISTLFFTRVFWLVIKKKSIGFGILFSFILLILVGALLMMMPHFSQGDIPWVDALFVSTSALCVTGLSTFDIGDHLTSSGVILLMLLFQIGGLGPVTLLLLISTTMAKQTSIKKLSMVKNVFTLESISETKVVVITILSVSIFFESIGALLLYLFDDKAHDFMWALFHSVSAFCNAGFSLQKDSFMSYGSVTLLILSALIVAGGLGFPLYFDMIRSIGYYGKRFWKKSDPKEKNSNELKFKHLQLQTVLSLKVTAGLIVFGVISFCLLEWNHSEQFLSSKEGIVKLIFQSISFRTAGFNSVDLNQLTMGSQIMTFIYMIIGAGSLSTGGGIKVMTIVVVIMTVLSYMRGNEDVVFGVRRISVTTVKIAVSIVSLYCTLVALTFIALGISETGFSFIELLYESVSALSTVGVTLGVTAQLSTAGKIIIMVAMIFGRIGPITVIVMFFRKKSGAHSYRYPKAHVTLG